jgi:hypothetical protein
MPARKPRRQRNHRWRTIESHIVPEFDTSVDAAVAASHYVDYIQPPPRFHMPPPMDTMNTSWGVTLLLWWCMWNRSITFLHIPKTGGTAIELIDPGAPIHRFAAMHAIRGRDGVRSLSLVSHCNWWPRAHALQDTPPNLVHLSPTQWRRCYGEHWSPYQRTGSGPHEQVYCVVRDPVDRFVSEFLFARLHWYWPRRLCPLKHPWERRLGRLQEELWCFARLTQRLLLSYERQWRRQWTAGIQGGLAAGRQGGLALNLSEFLLHVLPQHSFVADDSGELGCDLAFSFHDLQHAALPPFTNQHNYFREKNGKGRSLLHSYIRSNASFMALLHSVYPHDFQLWDRVRLHQRPTARHVTSVGEEVSRLLRQLPRLPNREPSCQPQKCDCPPCCLTSYNLTSSSLRFGCFSCVLAHPECGGLGRWEPWQIPRRLGAACGSTPSACNTCKACCEAAWVDSGGASCLDCEREECRKRNSSLWEMGRGLLPMAHTRLDETRKARWVTVIHGQAEKQG